MAYTSGRVARARGYVFESIANVNDESLRKRVLQMLVDAQSHPALSATCGEDSVHREWPLEKLGRPLPYDPTWAAPGAALSSHHCYPGGWAIHTALNLNAALHLADQVEHLKGIAVEKDGIIAAMALHDWAKLKLLCWSDDHTLDAEGSGGHHWMAIAECMLKGFPPGVVQLLAGAHGGWWSKPESVGSSLQSAAERIGLDPGSTEYVPSQELLTVESWIMRQAEESWYSATRRAVQEVRGVVRAWWEARALPYVFERVQNAVFSAFDELALHQEFRVCGRPSLFEKLDSWCERVL